MKKTKWHFQSVSLQCCLQSKINTDGLRFALLFVNVNFWCIKPVVAQGLHDWPVLLHGLFDQAPELSPDEPSPDNRLTTSDLGLSIIIMLKHRKQSLAHDIAPCVGLELDQGLLVDLDMSGRGLVRVDLVNYFLDLRMSQYFAHRGGIGGFSSQRRRECLKIVVLQLFIEVFYVGLKKSKKNNVKKYY